MRKWAYARIYANSSDHDSKNQSIVLRIWANYLGVQGEKQFIKLHEETVQDRAFIYLAVNKAVSLVHHYVGYMGMQGWEIISINHMAIFYQDEYGNSVVPDFYLKKEVE